MPIEVNSEIKVLPEDDFHKMAERIIGIAFGVHNDLGRLMDEEIYKQAIRLRCESAGIAPARREVQIRVTNNEFTKYYFMDLLFANALMVEAKAIDHISKAHHAQAIHYLLLAGMQHGLLLNFRPARVEKRFISSHLNPVDRRNFVLHTSDWRPVNDASRQIVSRFSEILDDWGAFLHTSLYRDAIVHLLGGPVSAIRRIPVRDGQLQLGTHEVCMISDDTALTITALSEGKESMLRHLRRFLSHTDLRHIQWINLDRHDIEFRTLSVRKMLLTQ